MSRRYDVHLDGCDDSTIVVGIELTPAEHAAIVRLTESAEKASEYGCQPTMRIAPTTPAAPTAQTGARP